VWDTDVPFFSLLKHGLFFSQQQQQKMKGSPDRIQACTTTHFDGSIAVTDPEKSWVARWQRTSACFFLVFVPCLCSLHLFLRPLFFLLPGMWMLICAAR
jgi:hypothetical protein